AELTTLPVTLKSPQISRYAGLDVRLTQSGTSIDKPGRLSKGGNAYLRSAMFMPAMSAIRCDPYVKAFYDVLVGRGKRKMQAICAVMRKYLTGLWACIRAGEDFDTAKLFSEKHLLKA
ncbi:IS110 family transposase, partial [Pseudomonas umsongensis]